MRAIIIATHSAAILTIARADADATLLSLLAAAVIDAAALSTPLSRFD